MIPTFAVVGRSNRGKSSIVAALTENDQIPISPLPRTTTMSQFFTMTVDHRDLFTIFDTPGFEEAPAALEWLNAVPVEAHRRRERVAEFVATFASTDRFRFECELLGPILDGASIIYIADASHPYRSTYEAEFEILRWTGQPSLALINKIGNADYVHEWEQALNQYFKKVIVFNAHTSLFEDRIALLEELRFLNQELRPPLEIAIETLKRQREDHVKACAMIIAEYLRDAVSHSLTLPAGNEISENDTVTLGRRLQADVRKMEEKMQTRLARQLNFTSLEILNRDLPPPQDLFSENTYKVLGVPRENLILAAALSGVLGGAFVDAHVGGASFGLGAVLGGVLGGAGALYVTMSDPKFLGVSISTKGRIVQLSIHDYPWILLDRAVIFQRALLKRTHAAQEKLEVGETPIKQGPTSTLSVREVSSLMNTLRKIRKNPRDAALLKKLANAVEKLPEFERA